MECNKCGWVMPCEEEFVGANCISCEGKIQYTADEYLADPNLGLVTETRNAQVELSSLVKDGIKHDQTVVVEAGTGVGKSFAYLLPALLSKKRTVISTAKKTLQTQLIKKDLPYLEKKLNLSNPKGPLYARAYGRSNYACYTAATHKKNKGIFSGAVVKEFFDNTEYGVWEEAPAILHRTAPKLLKVISNGFRDLSADDCSGKLCNHYSQCHYIEARKNVSTAQVIVANHWLTGLDMMMTQSEKVTYFGGNDVLIVDEAHKFEDGVRSAFTQEIKRSVLQEMINKVDDARETLSLDEAKSLGPSAGELPYQKALVKAWNALFAKLRNTRNETTVGTLGQEGTDLTLAISDSVGAINPRYLNANFNVARQRNTAPNILVDGLNPFKPAKHRDEAIAAALRALTDGSRELYKRVQRLSITLSMVSDTLNLIKEKDQNNVVYVENNGRYLAIKIAPINIAGFLREHSKHVATTVYTSATLAVGGNLKHFGFRMGVDMPTALTAQYGSAFDYSKQALLYISRQTVPPAGGQDPSDAYIEKLTDEVYDLIHASNGNAFVLFTSTREMVDVHAGLVAKGCVLPLVTQDGPAAESLRVYKKTPNAVLLGLKSFWEGVDIPGSKLELVIIIKLPFPLRSDPIIQAKCERAGDRWFREVYIPEMILDLRQGVGRLIRSQKDRGVVAILDARLEKKSYKNTVLRSLGFTQVTANKPAALKALRNLAAQRT